MLTADLALAKRLERAEGFACVQFAEARRKLHPECGSTWMEIGGAWVAFDGVDSPLTQSFGLGLFEELTAETMDKIEGFFFERGSAAVHEMSPLAGAAALELLCRRGYVPIEVSNVLYGPVENSKVDPSSAATAHLATADEMPLWADTSARGWSHEHPELYEFLVAFGELFAARQQSPCFLGEVDGKPGAAAALALYEGVALFAGAATVPELRRRGLQAALLAERMRYAFAQGCDLAMMVTEAGSNSQRNGERQGFRVAYTRVKWRLGLPGS